MTAQDGTRTILVPRENSSKVLQDLASWLKHHRDDWTPLCHYHAAQLGRFAHLHKELGHKYGVAIELEAHDTRRKTYTFAFKKAYPVALEDMIEREAAAGRFNAVKILQSAIEQLQAREANGKLISALTLVVCEGVTRVDPHGYTEETLSAFRSTTPSNINENNWPDHVNFALVAPIGIHPAVESKMHTWWKKNGPAWGFCCVNILKLTASGALPGSIVQFELMYEHQGTLNDPVQKCRFIPFSPKKKLATGERKNSRDVRDGLHGTVIWISVMMAAVEAMVTPCWISDEELKRIEIRDDWEYHFYSLLQNYDLAY